jgi:hypothetical protein
MCSLRRMCSLYKMTFRTASVECCDASMEMRKERERAGENEWKWQFAPPQIVPAHQTAKPFWTNGTRLLPAFCTDGTGTSLLSCSVNLLSLSLSHTLYMDTAHLQGRHHRLWLIVLSTRVQGRGKQGRREGGWRYEAGQRWE